MKYIEIEEHGRRGTDNGCSSPYGRCGGILDFEQISQEQTNSLTSSHIWSHQKSWEISSKILLNPNVLRLESRDEIEKPEVVQVLVEYTAGPQSTEDLSLP